MAIVLDAARSKIRSGSIALFVVLPGPVRELCFGVKRHARSRRLCVLCGEFCAEARSGLIGRESESGTLNCQITWG